MDRVRALDRAQLPGTGFRAPTGFLWRFCAYPVGSIDPHTSVGPMALKRKHPILRYFPAAHRTERMMPAVGRIAIRTRLDPRAGRHTVAGHRSGRSSPRSYPRPMRRRTFWNPRRTYGRDTRSDLSPDIPRQTCAPVRSMSTRTPIGPISRRYTAACRADGLRSHAPIRHLPEPSQAGNALGKAHCK